MNDATVGLKINEVLCLRGENLGFKEQDVGSFKACSLSELTNGSMLMLVVT